LRASPDERVGSKYEDTIARQLIRNQNKNKKDTLVNVQTISKLNKAKQ